MERLTQSGLESKTTGKYPWLWKKNKTSFSLRSPSVAFLEMEKPLKCVRAGPFCQAYNFYDSWNAH